MFFLGARDWDGLLTTTPGNCQGCSAWHRGLFLASSRCPSAPGAPCRAGWAHLGPGFPGRLGGETTGPENPELRFLLCPCYSGESLERFWFSHVKQKTSEWGKSKENLPLNLTGVGAGPSVGKETDSGLFTDEWGQCGEPARPRGVAAARMVRYGREPQRGDAASP